MTVAGRYPSFRAPRADRQVLCVPPWPTLASSLPHSRRALADSDVKILSTPLAELAREARRSLVTQARHYTAAYADISELARNDDLPLVLTGHQPELVHPGVWLKNFAAAQLAKQSGGLAVSLIIDNDLCRLPSVRVPTGTVEEPQVVDVPFDQPLAEMPYEERNIADRAVWNSFGDRATHLLAPLVPHPMLIDWWPAAVAAAERNPNLGLALAQARHRLEHDWGSRSLEIPFSQVCQTKPFLQFLLHLLSDASLVRQHYNAALTEYRLAHQLRSAAQPLPDLITSDGWIETPFWIWTTADPTRRALFVQSGTSGLLLSDRHYWQQTLPTDTDDALQQLAQWQTQGVKLRTRALTTTLYTRLLISDTFIHGIGGAKYDQVTDSLCRRLFGVELPGLVTLSGTLQLPIAHQSIDASRESDLKQTLRELRFHPESHVAALALDEKNHAAVEAWIAQKQNWIATTKTPSNAAERHAGIVAANEALQAWLEPRRERVEQELRATLAQNRTNRLLESREYPFCLFPRELLRDFLLDFSSGIP